MPKVGGVEGTGPLRTDVILSSPPLPFFLERRTSNLVRVQEPLCLNLEVHGCSSGQSAGGAPGILGTRSLCCPWGLPRYPRPHPTPTRVSSREREGVY